MGFDKNRKLEELSRNLWRSSYQRQIIELDSWFQFSDLFFDNPGIKQLIEPLDQIIDNLFPLGKVDNLAIFLSTGEYDHKFVLRECIKTLERLGFINTKNIFILVLNPSISGINILFFSPKRNESIETVKIIHFPQGKVPDYFQEII